jgi:non-reducing end alpha-L-arabinofuranosidase
MLSLLSATPAIATLVESRAAGPCNIYDTAGTPCVAAHSMVRALYADYSGPLYLVQRESDKATTAIFVGSAGYADSATQDTFCAGTSCVVTRIFDQSPKGNHLNRAPWGGASRHSEKGVNATKHKLTLNGHAVYGAYFEGGMGYRCDSTWGVATGNNPESMYMVTNGNHFNGGCCFDYGNAETDALDEGKGTMEAIYWGNSHGWSKGAGAGPWVMADIENALWAGKESIQTTNQPIVNGSFVAAMVKGGSDGFALLGGDATQTGGLKKLYEGPRPPGYQPMKKEGAIILGIGGDSSDWAIGTFYEGVMTTGYASDATDQAVHANIVAAGYGK